MDVARYAEQLEFCVRNAYSPSEFIERCRDEGLPVSAQSLHTDLYCQLVKLDKANKNGVWARIIKNAFAPLFVGKVDFVVGNPPWVNWESLPQDYRETTKPLWQRYGLFTLKGHSARLGGGKKDLSMLFVYLSFDNYLIESGTLGFVITQTLFKTREAGDGFRRFRFQRGDKNVFFSPVNVIDMTELHPFEGATNRTATLVCREIESGVKFPVPYEYWTPKPSANITEDSDWETIRNGIDRMTLAAIPMKEDSPNSAWLTAPKDCLSGLAKVMGATAIQAHAGVCTWMNGVFWLRSVTPAKAGRVRVQNWFDVGKIKVAPIDDTIEEDLVYPLLRGRDVHRWTSTPSVHILLTQNPETRTGIAEGVMKRKYPRTFQYLRNFEALLKKRPGYIKYFDPDKDSFWTIYNVGPYSVSPFRVVYKELTDFFQCAVVEPTEKPAIADTKLRFINCQSAAESYFLCGLLNSSPAILYLYASATWVQTADYQASDISRVALPAFKDNNNLHQRISEIARLCHESTTCGDSKQLTKLETDLDLAAQLIWKITEVEMNAIHSALVAFGFRNSEHATATFDD